ncbi:Flp pilus assembly protein, ATPase CpaE [Abditibacterium utsteinense]|uniref:Flp pilus assembly protein, ATPase CpaE n=1 Tax=Abditibacterium utsteinense TaxID=1960156 RepID=A0A2S8ST89_9BACT|nr:response regulator [Abditibacterium utsteinense]PQV63998.1 Flp pilus assembly protein, ATPase CpaE [Abditibacterium utsteinense]
MESSLIRILPACLTAPLPAGWDASNAEFVIEVMPEVEQAQAIILALPTTEPDILLLDADAPGVDIFAIAAQALEARPTLAVVLVSAENSPDNLRRAMLAGAEEYLIKPLEATALRESILGIAGHQTLRVIERDAEEETTAENARGLVVGVVSGKGGLGKTTLAVNLASVVASAPGKTAGVIGLESGDGSILLNMQPKLGLFDLAGDDDRREEGGYAIDWMKQFATNHKMGLSYWQWSGFATPSDAGVPDDFVPALFDTCRRAQSVTFIDFPILSGEEASAVLPLLDVILVITSSSDLLAMRSTKTFIDLIPEELAPRVRVIINRSDPSDMISRDDFEAALEFKIAAVLPNEPSIAAQAINMGSPFVLTQASSELATTVKQLAQVLFRLPMGAENPKPRKRFMLF